MSTARSECVSCLLFPVPSSHIHIPSSEISEPKRPLHPLLFTAATTTTVQEANIAES